MTDYRIVRALLEEARDRMDAKQEHLIAAQIAHSIESLSVRMETAR